MSSLQFAQAGELLLHFRQEGRSDGPVLVFINSLGCDLRIWDGMIPAFVNDYRLLRYDKRGHGLSDCPPAPYSMADHGRDLALLLDALDIDCATLIGISIGGQIAMQFSLDYPDRVEALIVSDTNAKIGTAEYWDERVNALQTKGMPHLAPVILERWFGLEYPEREPKAFRGYFNMLTRIPLEGYIGCCQSIRDADLREGMGALQVSTLVLCGAQDRATVPEAVEAFAATIPSATYAEIERAGHLPCIEAPDQMSEIILRFLKESLQYD